MNFIVSFALLHQLALKPPFGTATTKKDKQLRINKYKNGVALGK